MLTNKSGGRVFDFHWSKIVFFQSRAVSHFLTRYNQGAEKNGR